jgi:hypothetical protein
MDFYYHIPEYPENANPGGIFTRLFDGLGFRFYWATEGLGEKEYSFRPSEDCMSIGEIISHIWGLVNWMNISFDKQGFQSPDETSEIIYQTLEIIKNLRETTQNMENHEITEIKIRDYPFWHILNGPLADAFTHVGQINSFRRLAGKPVSKANVFTGLPPTSEKKDQLSED